MPKPGLEAGQCPECGAEIPPGQPKGLCPRCALKGALELGEPDTLAPASGHPLPSDGRGAGGEGRSFGDYELLEEIARGGMGVVYKARQRSLDRFVAVKVLLFGTHASAEFIKRFRIEASAAAALQHPNIVSIHEVGVHEGEHFLVMDYVDGPNLAQFAKDQPLPAKHAAQYLKTIADAIHYAHEKGILHRDLKPSNVLIDANDQPRVTDFGLAKRLSTDSQPSTDLSQLTLSGHVLGSPGYMPPEQAAGARGKIGRRSDVYSLGAMLYHLLTGRPPFQGENVADTLYQVLNTEPVSPRLLQPRLPVDLETICLKCLEKEPAKRFASAQELAKELGRFLNDESIHSRPVGAPEKVWRWCRRKPAMAALIVLVPLLGVAGLSGILWQWHRANRNAETEARHSRRAEAMLSRLEQEKAERVFEADQAPAALEQLARLLRRDPTNRVAATRLLSALSLRNFAVPVTQPIGTTAAVNSVRFDLDGSRIVTASYDGSAQVWDMASGQPLTLPLRHLARVRYAEFSPDGRWVVTASGDATAQVWDASTGQRASGPLRHTKFVNVARFSPDGRWVATGSDDGTAMAWDAQTGQAICQGLRHQDHVMAVEFTPDGKRLFTASFDQTARLWDIVTGRQWGESVRTPFRIYSAALSPDGARALLGGLEGVAGIWSLSTGQRLGNPLQHAQKVQCVQFSPEGLRVVTAAGKTARVWEARTGRPLTEPILHDSPVTFAEFTPDGRRLMTSSISGGLRLWEISEGAPGGEPMQHASDVMTIAFSPDGSRLATTAFELRAAIWDAQTARPIAWLEHGSFPRAGGFSSDGGTLLTVAKKSVHTWDGRTGLPRRAIGPISQKLQAARLSRDGRWIITGSADNTANLWEAVTGRQMAGPMRHAHSIVFVEFSADGTRVATASEDKTARVWDARTGLPVTAPLPHDARVCTVRFSPNGGTVLTASEDGSAKLWEVTTSPKLLWTFRHEAGVLDAEFSPDGRRVVTASADKTARVWDAETGQAITETLGHGDVVMTAGFSADGERVVTASADATGRVWDVRTGLSLSEPLRHDAGLLGACFSPDSIHVATCSIDDTARLWEAPTFPLPVPLWLADLAEAVVGRATQPVSTQAIDPLDRLARIHQEILALPATNGYARWSRWYFADRSERTLSPSSRLTMKDYVARRLELNTAEAVEEALRLSPTNATAAARLARLLAPDLPIRQPDLESEARWHGRRALSLAPASAEAWWTQALFLCRDERIPEALEAINRALLSSPGEGELWRLKSQCLARLGRLEEALAAVSTAIDLSRGDGDGLHEIRSRALQDRARLFTQINRPAEAAKDVREHLALLGIPSRDAGLPDHLIDLSAHFSQSLDQDVAGNSKTRRVFANLPRGSPVLAGVEFDVRGIVVLAEARSQRRGISLAKEVRDIVLARRCRLLHFLHGVSGQLPAGTQTGHYSVHYTDGRTLEIPLRYGEEVTSWWQFAPPSPGAESRLNIAWSDAGPVGGVAFLCKTTWTNPRPEAEVRSLDFVSAMTNSIPFLIAITAE